MSVFMQSSLDVAKDSPPRWSTEGKELTSSETEGKSSRKSWLLPFSSVSTKASLVSLCSKARHWGNSSLLMLPQNLNWVFTLSQSSFWTGGKSSVWNESDPGGRCSHLWAVLPRAYLAPVSYNPQLSGQIQQLVTLVSPAVSPPPLHIASLLSL